MASERPFMVIPLRVPVTDSDMDTWWFHTHRALVDLDAYGLVHPSVAEEPHDPVAMQHAIRLRQARGRSKLPAPGGGDGIGELRGTIKESGD